MKIFDQNTSGSASVREHFRAQLSKFTRVSNESIEFFDQNNRGSASVVGPEEEREPLEFRTFLNHHDVVMMMT